MVLGLLLSDLDRLLFHDQIYVLVQATVFLPISLVICMVEWSRGTRNKPMLSVEGNAQDQHAARVAAVAAAVRTQSKDGGLFTSRPDRERISSRIMPPRKRTVDTSQLKNVVQVDTEKGIVVVEPRLRMVELSHYLLRHGYTVPCVPELDDLTVGGLLMGCGIESTSWKYGMFNEICQAYELVTCTGEVQTVTEASDKELFFTLPWSHGTHGILVGATLQIIPAKPFVRLQLSHYADRSKLCEQLQAAVSGGSHEFVEGLAFSPTSAVVMKGSFVDQPEDGDPLLSLGRWFDPWFFKQVQSIKNGHVYMRTDEYLHRHSKSIFWELSYLQPWGNTPLFRYLLGWVNPLNIALVKSYQPEFTMRYYCNVNVIQDYLIPITELKPMLDVGDEALGVYPIWLCPYLNKHHEVVSIHHPHSKDKDVMYIDVGYYGLPSVRGFDMKRALRRIEEWLIPRKGFVMLYALHTLNHDDLRKMFNLEAYERVRARMGSAAIFPTIDEKVKVG
mmetsp:Transcript_55331/g.103802  ORF Transcript_55331/g.103802 Transcript_55331/m.103802 type:complete len:503 (+) Transcript_55331:131-1639(+)